MLSLNINNSTVENFYKQECNNDENKFISNIMHYIETYNIKQSVKKGLEEVKLQNYNVPRKNNQFQKYLYS